MKPTLLISRALPEKNLSAARAAYNVTLRDTTDAMRPDDVTDALNKYDAVLPTLGDQFTGDAIRAASPKCKIIANFGVGYNHIDADAAREMGIAVTNTPGAVTDATADIALMLILMTARRAGEGERMVRARNWTGWQPTQMLGLHVSGKTIGIIGMGRIGQAIAKRCHDGFGCKIVFANRSEKTVDGAMQLKDAAAVASAADVIVVATPGGPATHHLIGAKFFAAMRPHAIFVNISRGDVVDEAALVSALKNAQIGGAGLDVYENEPSVSEALLGMENVTLLPHLGTAALDVRESMGQMALDNLAAHFAGEALPNPV
ncbi:2-hydroxyacid dehydrogenase [Litoreibacter roseus]|uniref:D-glycerate dehydrogenase n=1 Tax=Litoreibacter roseus TaxID=2601869 RepID=A0A6N6JBV0_9RHOB|nr:D-glycerate dehydrogenase [Litoreibacter roseus]GFE63330.1 D-glycerate dehydrogenase [Litoreibacter roseus]